MTSQIPLFKMTIVGPLPWGSGGHRKSKNPVNDHLNRNSKPRCLPHSGRTTERLRQ